MKPLLFLLLRLLMTFVFLYSIIKTEQEKLSFNGKGEEKKSSIILLKTTKVNTRFSD
jgi:hypothetical protein